MLNVLVQGKLTADPRRREAINGNAYTTAQLAVDTPNGSILCGLIAFDTAGDRLAELHKGEALAATGEAKLTTWEKGGEHHMGLSVTVAEVLTLYAARKRRNKATSAQSDDRERAVA